MDFPPELLRKIFSYQKKWWLTNDLRLIDIAKLSQIPRTIFCEPTEIHTTYYVLLTISDSKSYQLGYFKCTKNFRVFYCFAIYHTFGQGYWDQHLLLSNDHVNWIKGFPAMRTAPCWSGYRISVD
jgi:hypothetical protein